MGQVVELDENVVVRCNIDEALELMGDDPSVSHSELDSECEMAHHNPQFIDMRHTFNNQTEKLESLEDKQFIARAKTIQTRLIYWMLEHRYIYQHKYTSGFETLNKLGVNCRAHFHLRFQTQHMVQTVRKQVKRWLLDKYGEDTTGNLSFMFKSIIVPRCEEEYWRYPLKISLDKKKCGGFSDQDLERMHQVAHESFQKVVQINQAKMDKRDKTDTLYERLKIKLEKSGVSIRTPLLILSSKFYVEEQRPVNRQVINGYVDLFMLEKGHISHEDYWA